MSGSDIVSGTLELVILKTVADGGALHGYGLGRAIRERTSAVLKVGESVLYPALHRLEVRGDLRAEWGVTETGREARYYRLTRQGRRRLKREGARWIERSEAVLTILAHREEEA